MNCNETFNAGICYVTDAYKRVCRFNEELHADLEKCRSENVKLRELLIDLKCAPCCGDSCWLHLPERLRELGVEVDR